jgi:hypothetical protein
MKTMQNLWKMLRRSQLGIAALPLYRKGTGVSGEGVPVHRPRKCSLFAFCALGGLAILSLPSLQADPEFFPSTGHYYEVISVRPQQITWEEAQAAATARGGYLATISSAVENSFVFNLVNNSIYWRNGGTNSFGPWIGGYQPAGSSEPDGGWTWVNGEGSFAPGSSAYANWALAR